ncbi:MAG: sirohydrochlorin chelatase [Mycobacteriales bacterium]
MSDPVLLAVAHGSRDPAAAAAHDALMARIHAAAPGLEARLAYVDHVAPSIRRALENCAEQERSVVVVPLFLSAAAHTKGDIPGAIRQVRQCHPELSVTYARVLGPDPLLLRALCRQLAVAGVLDSAGLILAAAGSADPDANAEVAKAARLLWEWRGGGAPVEYGFASATGPTVAQTADRLRALGYHEIAVATYFMAPGRLPHRAWQQAGAVPASATLADTPEVAQLVLQRYAEAVAATPVAGCDTCVYRAPWPGQEHRVASPQRPHAHPADVAAQHTHFPLLR